MFCLVSCRSWIQGHQVLTVVCTVCPHMTAFTTLCSLKTHKATLTFALSKLWRSGSQSSAMNRNYIKNRAQATKFSSFWKQTEMNPTCQQAVTSFVHITLCFFYICSSPAEQETKYTNQGSDATGQLINKCVVSWGCNLSLKGFGLRHTTSLHTWW